MPGLDGVNPELRQRIQGVLIEAGGKIIVSSALRSRQEQQQLWDAAVRQYGSERNAVAHVARPGTSNHELGLAVDIACTPAYNSLRAMLIDKYGLHTPVPGEAWHCELAVGRKAIPTPPNTPVTIPTVEEATSMLKNPAVKVLPTLSGAGYWIVAADGGVFSYGDAVFYGSLGGVKLKEKITDAAIMPDGKGYVLLGGDGGIFNFGSSPFHGSAVGIVS